jgi:glycosyltransferase involved in cell wall biosynthesis
MQQPAVVLKMTAVITVISDLSTDMRVQKQANILKEMGYDVTLIGRSIPGAPPVALDLIKMVTLPVPFRRGPLMYLSFNFILMLQLFFRKADLFVANDLDTLLPCFAASRLFGKPLVYDAHEYFTGQYGLAERRLKHFLWKRMERCLLPRIKDMITVSDSIASLYREEYGVDPVVVRNISSSTAHLVPHRRSDLDEGRDDLLVVFQGSGINAGRGAGELISAMTDIKGVRLVIIGSGDIIKEIRMDVSERGLTPKVTFLPRMPWDEMMKYTMCCDAGLSLDTDTCLNQRYSLPNKLFDYIAAGIPAVVSPLPEVSAVIDRYGSGLVLDEMTPAAIKMALEKLRDDISLLNSLKDKAVKARSELNWETESKIERKLFENVTR